ncbi:MAG: toll/interleukin-1 receptor domain-containing protein [Oxalobacteraceae bacterium]|nr:MAG: toll/interleukin-1 receptor domain-containing protein [Oxalobacteraceae bacterium]
MPITLSSLSAASRRASRTTAKQELALESARAAGKTTVFLCHSHADRSYVIGLVELLHEEGWDAYVDWMDDTMPPRPNRTTAERIKLRIRQADYFMFLATPNSTASRWCPWEIGFADGVKPIDTIMVVQTQDGQGNNYGNEYLDLYRKVDVSQQGPLGAWRPGEASGAFVKTL